MRKLNIKRLVTDLGGVKITSLKLGLSRTTPYRWIEQGHMSTRILEEIKTMNPEIDINKYMEIVNDE